MPVSATHYENGHRIVPPFPDGMQLAQFAMGELGNAALAIGVFVPEETILVARPTDFHGIAKGLIFAGRVEHQIHLAAHALAHCMDVGNLLADRCPAPAMNFKRGVSNLE